MYREITIINYSRSSNFGWGYSFTPTGEDAYSIEIPARPYHVGTLGQIADAIANDRTWQSKGGLFYNTAWFYDGLRILSTWKFDIVSQPSPDEAANYGWTWVNGWHPPEDDADVTIRVEVSLLTAQDIAREFNISPRRARSLAKHRHEKYGIGQQLPGGQWVFDAEDLDLLRPDPRYKGGQT